jgi:hypothetical protein
MKTKRISRNIVRIDIEGVKNFKLAILSDLHWDNPHCNRELLKEHLDYCVKHNIPVFLNGDTFCLMQGRGDRRSNKSDLRPEHNNSRYLDSVVETAVDWFSPYKDILKVVGYGNHETAILKWQETDVLSRFVDLFNYKNKSDLICGGYSGWIWIVNRTRGTSVTSARIKYHHGAGGGGIITKGALGLSRALMYYDQMDCYTTGHIHENWSRNDVKEVLVTDRNPRVEKREVHLAITGTYKDEYEDGYMGFHIERGRNPRVIGGRILNIQYKRIRSKGDEKTNKLITSTRFPL